MTVIEYEQIRLMLIPVMKQAGAAILELQKTGFKVRHKSLFDIVTEGDLVANEILQSALFKAYPDYGWLSEESVDNPQRLEQKRVWIVDPIDGTREFAQNIPEYAISVALVEDGIPIVAAVYNPAQQKLFSASRAGGAYLNEKRIMCRQKVDSSQKLSLLASRSEYQRGKWDRFLDHDITVIGSIAYKLALIAEGVADATFSLGNKNEWDVAAGVLIVQESGGKATNKQKETIYFNQPNVLINGIVATSNKTNDLVFELITQ